MGEPDNVMITTTRETMGCGTGRSDTTVALSPAAGGGDGGDDAVLVQRWMCEELSLGPADLLTYAIIYSRSKDGSSVYTGGLEYLRRWGVWFPHKVLERLERRGLIRRVSSWQPGGVQQITAYQAVRGHNNDKEQKEEKVEEG